MNKKEKVISTYNAAADSFDKGPLGFWSAIGRETVACMQLKKGETVLDVCCGSGASALPAAELVGREGMVTGVDMADSLLSLGRNKARAKALDWVRFLHADITQTSFQPGEFDAVVCVFGIFFFEDMAAQLAKFWEYVKPSGQLVITTWGKEIFAPAYSIWAEQVSAIRPELIGDFNPWDDITTKEGLSDLFSQAGISNVKIVHLESKQALDHEEDFWTIALGSGLRWVVEQLNPEEQELLKKNLISEIKKHNIQSVKTDALIARAIKEP
ncbi:class I SAM-dependent methyltransferase [Flavobacteriaceae bacterium 3-367]